MSFNKIKTTGITNIYATKSLKNLYPKSNKITIAESSKILQNAFDIYNNIMEKKNHFTINTMLKLLFELQNSEKVLSIWDDIKSLHQQSNNDSNNTISYQMVLKCCITAPNVEIDKCLQILSWMEQRGIKFIVHISFITKLISKCGNDLNALNKIVNFMQKSVINNTNPKNYIIIKTALINAYGICSNIQAAKDIFYTINDDQINVVCIGAMMNALINNNLNEDAIDLYIEYESMSNYVTQMKALKACSNIGDFDKGRKIIKHGLNTDNIKLKGALIDFYRNSGNINMALNIFNLIDNLQKDIVHFNTMMTAYIDNNQHSEALQLYDNIPAFNKMIEKDNITHILALKACTILKDLQKGKQIHTAAECGNKHKMSMQLKTTLITFYGTLSQIQEAKAVFDSIESAKRNILCINAMMTVFVHNKCYQQALQLYDGYYYLTDDISHMMAIKGCIGINNFDRGKRIISGMHGTGMYNNPQLISTMIDFYGHFGDIDTAEKVYQSIEDEKKSIVNICVMMNVYIENGQNEKAMELYDSVRIIKDDTCYMLAIKACMNLGDFERGKQIHCEIGTTLDDIKLMNTLIHLYGDTLDIDTAIDIFNRIEDKKKTVVTIGTMMNAYCKSNLNEECIELFKSLISLNIEPDVICYRLLFTACTNVTNYYYGSQFHDKLKNSKDLKWMLRVNEIQINLINMYGKCGMLDKSQEIFDDIKRNEYNNKYSINTQIWNAIIHTYGRNNYVDKSMELYHKMKDDIGLKPDNNTYKILLNACSHSGDDKLGRNIWMKEINDIEIKYDVYVMTAFIDCISRKGYITEAYEYIMEYRKITFDKLSDEVMYTALIAGCKKHNNLLIAQSVHNEMTKKFPNNSKNMGSASVMLQSLYSNNN